MLLHMRLLMLILLAAVLLHAFLLLRNPPSNSRSPGLLLPASLPAPVRSKFSGPKAGAGGDADSAASGAAADAATAAAAAVGGRKGGAGLGKGGGAAAVDGVQLHEHPPAELAPAGRARADLNDIEGATITSWQYMGASMLLRGAEARQALKDWVELLGDAHPVER